jgi:hypothetical protein
VLKVRGVHREGGGQRRQFLGGIDIEQARDLCGVPVQQGGALDEGTGAGAALRHADDLASVDGDLALSDAREAHLAAPRRADHRAVVPRGLDTERREGFHPRLPQPVERTADVLFPQRIVRGQQDIGPQQLTGPDEDGASPTAAAHDRYTSLNNRGLRAPQHQSRGRDLHDANGTRDRVGQRTAVNLGRGATNALYADSAAPCCRYGSQWGCTVPTATMIQVSSFGAAG